MSRVGVPAVLAAAGLLTLGTAPARAQQRFYSNADRVLIGDGGQVLAIATGPFDVFAATPFGILVYDPNGERWKTPLPPPIELVATRPSALAFDPAGGTLWLGTEAGDVFSMAPGFDRWDRVSGGFRGRVEAIVAWPTDGSVYIFAGAEWVRIAGGSFFPERVPVNALPPGVQRQATRLPDDPWFRAARGTLGLDPRNRRWQLTDVAEGRQPGEFWIGTDGGGMVHFDTRTGRQRWLRFGLADRGAASIAILNGTVWIGSDGRDISGGVAWTDRNLSVWGQQFREDGAPWGFVAEIASFGGATWFGAQNGLFRIEGRPRPEERGDWTRLTSVDGLASDRVRSLAVAADLLWAGTDRGLTAFDTGDATVRQPVFAGVRVSRMAARGDTLFVATDRGLHRLLVPTTAAAATAQPTAVTGSPAVRGRVTDVVADDSLMFVIADGAIVDLLGTGTPVRDGTLDRIGPPFRLALRDGQLWASGPRGIARRDPSSHAWYAFTVPDDVYAGPVVDVLPDGDYVWAATPAGAVRLRWR